MSTNCRFSIIVPVYNVEKYLNQCVDSVLSQTYKDFELILVDDGSNDKSPMICDEYSRMDDRVKVIHKQNGGPSLARNEGMKCATGEYLLFLDSDDYWNSQYMLEDVDGIIVDDIDVVVLKYLFHYENSGKDIIACSDFSKADFVDDTYENKMNQLVAEQLFDSGVWNKVFRREVLIDNKIFFEEGIIAEDIDWVARVMLHSTSVDIMSKPYYVYRKGRSGALTSSLKPKNITDTKDSLIRCLKYPLLQQKNIDFKKAYYNYVSYRYVIWLAENSLVKSHNQKQLFNEMKQYKWLLNYDSNKKVRLAKIANCCLGLKLTSKMLGIYLKRKF